MASASRDDTFWAFVWYLMNNPHKDNLSRQDIHRMAEKFASANATEITSATDPGGTYTDIEWPIAAAGASTVTAVGNSSTTTEDSTTKVDWALVNSASQVTLDQASWPEDHVGA